MACKPCCSHSDFGVKSSKLQLVIVRDTYFTWIWHPLKKKNKLWKKLLPMLRSIKESKLRLRTHWLRYSQILSIIPRRCPIHICGRNSPSSNFTKPGPHSAAWLVLTLAFSQPKAQGSLVRQKPLQLSECEQWLASRGITHHARIKTGLDFPRKRWNYY